MIRVPKTAKVRETGEIGDVLSTGASVNGVPAAQFWVLRFPDGQIRFYVQDSVEAVDWKSTH